MARLRTRAQLTEASKPPPQSAMSNRPRRAATAQEKESETSPQRSTTITIAREPSSSPGDGRDSIRLTVKMPPSKLREATSGNRDKPASLNSRDSLGPPEIVSGPRSSRAKRSVVIDSGSDDDDDDDEDDDEDAEGEEDEQDDQGDDDEEMDDDEGEEDAEGEEDEEEEDAEGESDVDMDDAGPPPPPIIQRAGPPSYPKLLVTPAPTQGQAKTVEAKEIEMANGGSDEDLSELPDEEDVDGEDIGEDDAMVEGDEDAEGDSDDDLSRDGTPDVTKMTKRQRGRVGDGAEEHFMSLNMEPQTKLHLTDEQRALRRSEMARRRKNLSEKRNEEEKMDTINRLLKKQAPKRRGKISAAEIAAGAETPEVQLGPEESYERAEPGFIRWVSNADGCRIGIPLEWKDKAAARVFGKGTWKMIEEVEG